MPRDIGKFLAWYLVIVALIANAASVVWPLRGVHAPGDDTLFEALVEGIVNLGLAAWAAYYLWHHGPRARMVVLGLSMWATACLIFELVMLLAGGNVTVQLPGHPLWRVPTAVAVAVVATYIVLASVPWVLLRTRRAGREFNGYPGPHCPACGRCLRGVSTGTCPQCGRNFTFAEFGIPTRDLADPQGAA